MIRRCQDVEFGTVGAIINDSAQAYRGVIPEDCWTDPYMSQDKLQDEISQGVQFWGYEETNKLVAVMGTQSLQGITLIRHAYVSTARRNCGIGGQMLSFLQGTIDQPLLIGTWADAVWAIDFYKKYGFQQVPQQEKNRLLKQYWTISDRQIETSVVLADKKWLNSAPVKRSQEGT